MYHKALSLLLLATLAACGGGDSPTETGFGAGRLRASIGPAGGVLRGAGGTDLAGFALQVPAGALARTVQVEVRVGEAIALPDSRPAARPLAITATPDPGGLRKPMRLQMRVDFPQGRDPADLFVAARQRTPGTPPIVRDGLGAEFGDFEQELRVFSADLSSLTDLQVRYTARPRRVDDANELLGLALDALDRLTDEGLIRADGLLAEALVADPYYPAARVLRSITRILVVLDARRSSGAGLQSFGELGEAFGLDLSRVSLLRRVVTGQWPRTSQPRRSLPKPADVLELLRNELRPALVAGLADLSFVPWHAPLKLKLPGPLAGLAGTREVDAADYGLLRAGMGFALWLIDGLGDVDLRLDLDHLFSTAGAAETYQSVLAQNPTLGLVRRRPAPQTAAFLSEALYAIREAVAQLNAETDSQGDDLIVFSSSFGPAKRDRWQGNLDGLLRSWLGGGPQTFAAGNGPALELETRALADGLDLRSWLPVFHRFEPIAGTLADPTLGGLLPGLTQDVATDWFRFANRHTMRDITIVVDGKGAEWPPATEALLPADAAGDARQLRGIDLVRVSIAQSGASLVGHMTLASGSFTFDPKQPRAYGLHFWVQRERPRRGGTRALLVVELTAGGPRLVVRRGGKTLAVRHLVATSGRELEFAVSRDGLFPAGEPVRDRVVRAISWGQDTKTGRTAGDETRRVLLRY